MNKLILFTQTFLNLVVLRYKACPKVLGIMYRRGKDISKFVRVVCSFLLILQTNAPTAYLLSSNLIAHAEEVSAESTASVDTTEKTNSNSPETDSNLLSNETKSDQANPVKDTSEGISNDANVENSSSTQDQQQVLNDSSPQNVSSDAAPTTDNAPAENTTVNNTDVESNVVDANDTNTGDSNSQTMVEETKVDNVNTLEQKDATDTSKTVEDTSNSTDVNKTNSNKTQNQNSDAWQVSDDKKEAKIAKVEEDKVYEAPMNSDVSVKFTDLPSLNADLTVKEVSISDDVKKEYGTVSNTAYDLDTNLKNGTFKYDLTIPYDDANGDGLVDGVKVEDLQILYSEDGENFVPVTSDKGVTTEVNKNDHVITVKGLTHFTTFVVASPTASSVTGAGATWSNTNNIFASDNNRATVVLPTASVVSEDLIGNNFGLSIPSNATILGVTVSIEKGVSVIRANASKDFLVSLMVGGSVSGNNKASGTYFGDVSTADAVYTYGSSSDTWGLTLTPADVNSSNFGVAYAVIRHPSATNTQTVRVDQIQVTVTYNTPPTTADVADTTNEDTVKTITMSGNDVDGDALTYSIVSGPVNGSLGSITGNQVDYTPVTNFNGTDTFTYKVNDGTIDSNTSTVTITVNAVNDTPTITLTSPNGGEDYAGESTQNITWTATDPDTSDTPTPDVLTVDLAYSTDGGATYPNSIATGLSNSGTYSWTPVPSIDSSTVRVRATVTDNFAASTNDVSNADFTIDSTAPTISQVAPVPTPANDPTPDYTFTTDEAGTISYGGDCSSATTVASVGGNTVTFNTLVDGAHGNCTVQVTDAAGNVGNLLPVSSFTVDTLPPTLTSVSIASDNANSSSYAKVGDTATLTFTSNENVQTPIVTIDGQTASVTGGPTSWTATYTFTGTDVEGVVPFTIDFMDLAGNAGTQVTLTSDATSVTFDRSVPLLTSFSTTKPAGTYGPTSTIDVTANYNETVYTGGTLTVTLNNLVSVPLTSISGSSISGTYTVGATGSGEDVSTLDVSAVTSENVSDTAGNIQSASGVPGTNISNSSVLNIDTTEPVLAPVTPVTTPTADNTPDYTFSSSETGTIAYGGDCSSATTATSVGSNTVTFNTLADGTHSSCTVQVTDNYGNASSVLNVNSFNVDTTVPTISTITITSDYNPYVRGDAPGFMFSADVSDSNTGIDGTTCQYTLDGSAWNSATYNPVNGTCSASGLLASDGTSLTLNIRIKDNVGNQATGSALLRTADSLDPVVSSFVILPTWGSYTSEAPALSATVTDSTSPIASCEYRTRVTGSGLPGWSPWTAATWTPNGLDPKTGTCTANPTGFSDGTSYDFEIRGDDGVGHTGTSSTLTRIVDTSVPSVDAGTDKVVNAAVLQDATVDGSVSGVASYAWSKLSGSGTVTFTPNGAEDTTLSANADDVYAIQLDATDNVGHANSDTMQLTWDQTKPVATLNVYTPDPTNDDTPTYTGNATDNLTNVVNVEYRIDGGSWTLATASDGTFDSTNEDFTFTPSALSDGTHTIEVRATDTAGNVQTSYASDTLTTDTTPPTGVVTLGTPTLYDGDLVQEVTVTYDEAMNTGINPTIAFGSTTGSISSNSDGVWDGTKMIWTETFTIIDANEETSNVTVTASDAKDLAANVQIPTAAATFNVDTKNPSAVVTLGTSMIKDADLIQEVTVTYDEAMQSSPSPTITFSATTGTWSSNSDGVWDDTGKIWTETFTVTDANEETADVTVTADGAKDLAGNIQNSATSGTFDIDTKNPTLLSFTSATSDGIYGPGSVINVTATYSESLGEGSTVTVDLDTGASVTLSSLSENTLSGSYTVGSTGSGENSTDLTVSSISSQSVTDLVGNTLTNTSLPGEGSNIADDSDIVVDTTVPDTTLTPYSPDPSSDQTPTYNGTATDTGGANVASVEWRLDGGAWQVVAAVDGAFDSPSEDFTFEVLPKLSLGGHLIEVRSTDSVGNVETADDEGSYALDNYTVIKNVVHDAGSNGGGGNGGNNSNNGNNGGNTSGGEVAGAFTFAPETPGPSNELPEVKSESTESVSTGNQGNQEGNVKASETTNTNLNKEIPCKSNSWIFLILLLQALMFIVLYMFSGFGFLAKNVVSYIILVVLAFVFAYVFNTSFCQWWGSAMSILVSIITLLFIKVKSK